MDGLKQFMQGLTQHRHAPTEQWNPPYCGELPIRITEDGSWLYLDSEIQRIELVKLFASVLVHENEQYFLITPAEKVKIQVDDLPFMITKWEWQEHDGIQVMVVETNLGDQIPLNSEHPIKVEGEKLAVNLDRNLTARVHRNVFYQWVEQAIAERADNGDEIFIIESAGERFEIGRVCAS